MSPSTLIGSRRALFIVELISPNGDFIRKLSDYVTSTKSSITYELSKFPIKLVGTLSNGKRFELELFKSAKWTAKFYSSK